MTVPDEADRLSPSIRIFLLDDHEVVRRGQVDLLQGDGDIDLVGESGLAQGTTRRGRCSRARAR